MSSSYILARADHSALAGSLGISSALRSAFPDAQFAKITTEPFSSVYMRVPACDDEATVEIFREFISIEPTGWPEVAGVILAARDALVPGSNLILFDTSNVDRVLHIDSALSVDRLQDWIEGVDT